ncbi:hypothetical protein SCA6_009184 [Theobroma cacao]
MISFSNLLVLEAAHWNQPAPEPALAEPIGAEKRKNNAKAYSFRRQQDSLNLACSNCRIPNT